MAELPPVVIVGAGIAGLVAALALARRGRSVTLVERAVHLEEVGAGIQLSPNASRVLLDLGLGDALRPSAVAPTAIRIRDARSNADIVRLPLGDIEARYGAPYWVVHRGDLQAGLLAAVGNTPGITLQLGGYIEATKDDKDGLVADILFGESRRKMPAEALIGADGVWSKMRTLALGGGPAVYSGRIAWRAVLPAEVAASVAIEDLTRATSLWLGSKIHLVTYPIRGGGLVNLIAATDGDWLEPRWDVPGDPAEIAAAFAAWPEPVRRLVSMPEKWRKWALCRAPNGPWTKGRTALIGDAAHAMLPFVAQGGAMAIEDAAVLARHLADTSRPVDRRLAAYAAERRPRALKIADAAARNGRIYHLSGFAADSRNAVIRLMGPDRMLARMDWIWGWRDRG